MGGRVWVKLLCALWLAAGDDLFFSKLFPCFQFSHYSSLALFIRHWYLTICV